jgi:uncharacterized protein
MQNLMSTELSNAELTLAKLTSKLAQIPSCVIAVSGGIDSMLLAYIAVNYLQSEVKIAHAYSPAVPSDAFARVKNYASQYAWQLSIIDAQELTSDSYVMNPVNRCYFCKSNLYQRIAAVFPGLVILSGTNQDDLSDYRPGLIAASEHSVRHIYVETNINKRDIYELARYLKLTDLEDIPAQPCLASRVETGMRISRDDLNFIDRAEQIGKQVLSDRHTLRCRLTAEGVYFEVAEALNLIDQTKIDEEIRRFCLSESRHFMGIRSYQKGSAFIHAG